MLERAREGDFTPSPASRCLAADRAAQHEQEKIFCFSSYAGVAVRRAGQGRFLGRVSAKVEHGLGQEHDGHDVREYAQVDKARLPRLEPALRAQPDGVDEVPKHA